jgi:hypothetical protein
MVATALIRSVLGISDPAWGFYRRPVMCQRKQADWQRSSGPTSALDDRPLHVQAARTETKHVHCCA